MRETVGKNYIDARAKQQDQINIFEAVQAIGADLMPKLMAMVEADKHETERDFFVEVCICMNPILGDVSDLR